MHDNLKKVTLVSDNVTPTGANGPVDFNAASDKYMIRRPHPFDIVRWGLITIELLDPDAGGFQIDLDLRPTVGSDTSRVNAAGGSIVRADADTIAAGTVAYIDVVLPVAASTGSDGSIVNVDGSGPLRVNPGAEAVFEVTNTVGAASTGYVWAEIIEYPFQGTNVGRVILDT